MVWELNLISNAASLSTDTYWADAINNPSAAGCEGAVSCDVADADGALAVDLSFVESDLGASVSAASDGVSCWAVRSSGDVEGTDCGRELAAVCEYDCRSEF